MINHWIFEVPYFQTKPHQTCTCSANCHFFAPQVGSPVLSSEAHTPHGIESKDLFLWTQKTWRIQKGFWWKKRLVAIISMSGECLWSSNFYTGGMGIDCFWNMVLLSKKHMFQCILEGPSWKTGFWLTGKLESKMRIGVHPKKWKKTSPQDATSNLFWRWSHDYCTSGDHVLHCCTIVSLMIGSIMLYPSYIPHYIPNSVGIQLSFRHTQQLETVRFNVISPSIHINI